MHMTEVVVKFNKGEDEFFKVVRCSKDGKEGMRYSPKYLPELLGIDNVEITKSSKIILRRNI